MSTITIALPITIEPTLTAPGYILTDATATQHFFYVNNRNKLEYDGRCTSIGELKKKRSEPKITTEGRIDGKWNITIRGVEDAELHSAEVAVLRTFGMKKKQLK